MALTKPDTEERLEGKTLNNFILCYDGDPEKFKKFLELKESTRMMDQPLARELGYMGKWAAKSFKDALDKGRIPLDKLVGIYRLSKKTPYDIVEMVPGKVEYRMTKKRVADCEKIVGYLRDLKL